MPFLSLFRSSEDAHLAHRVRVLERKIDLVLEHLGLSLPSDEFEEVRRLMEMGRKLDAIKEYRNITGVGLRDAKEAVERGV